MSGRRGQGCLDVRERKGLPGMEWGGGGKGGKRCLKSGGERDGMRKHFFFRYSRPQPECHLPNSPWAGIMTSYINYFRSREGLISDITAGDGNIKKLFFGV